MKLLRYGPKGREKPGMMDDDGKIRDLSGKIDDINPTTIEKKLERLKKIKPGSLPLVKGHPRIGAPIANFEKFLCIGLNYSDHAKETGHDIPKEPVLFSKHMNCVAGPNDDVVRPRGSKKMDWEVELAIVIGKKTKYVSKKDAMSHVAGYTIVNDVSEREFQIERGGQWVKGKACDGFGPMGPWLVTTDQITNPHELDIWLEVDGERQQDGNTKTMIFNVATIVSYLSKFMTLQPGDVIATGTPPGVGAGQKPQRFLKNGEVMTVGIEGLGVQKQKIVKG